METNETSIDDKELSFTEQVNNLEFKITRNINAIGGFVDAIKSSDPNVYPEFLKQYDDVNESFKATIDDARTNAEISANDLIKSTAIANLETILKYTDMMIDKYNISQYNNETTAMVVAEPKEEIVMQNVGPVRFWWDNLDPNKKTLIKSIAIGLAIFGGKCLFDYTRKKIGEKPVKKHEPEYEYEEGE